MMVEAALNCVVSARQPGGLVVKLSKRTTERVVTMDFDEAIYVGDERDGVYYQIGEGPGRHWYVSASVDCNTSHFTEMLLLDDGPYTRPEEAAMAGRSAAIDWCITNGISYKD